MFELTVTNTLTGDQNLVATFAAQGDLFIAMNALQAVAPKHLIYDSKNSEPVEWIFNWIGGGWNSIMAVNKAAAISAAIEKYEGHGKINSNLIDTKSFRVSTPSDCQNLLSLSI